MGYGGRTSTINCGSPKKYTLRGPTTKRKYLGATRHSSLTHFQPHVQFLSMAADNFMYYYWRQRKKKERQKMTIKNPEIFVAWETELPVQHRLSFLHPDFVVVIF
jgi:hypothetical protein